MTERRVACIETAAGAQRPELIAQYAATLQRLLLQQFPASAGYEHGLEWPVSACVDPRRHSDAIQRACRDARIKIVRGRDWGIAITTGPADIVFKQLRGIVTGAVPFVEGAQRWIMQIASGLGLLTGLVSFGVAIWQDPHRPRAAVSAAAVLGVAVFLAVTLLGFLLLSPIRAIFSSYRMREPILASAELMERAWAEIQGAFPGLPPLKRKRSPAIVYAGWLVVSLAVAGASYWLPHWFDLPIGVAIMLGALLAVAALAALGMLLGVIVSLFGLMKE